MLCVQSEESIFVYSIVIEKQRSIESVRGCTSISVRPNKSLKFGEKLAFHVDCVSQLRESIQYLLRSCL